MERKQMSKSVPTAATVIDSVLFRDAFGTPRMREVFSDHALVSRYVEVEIALARAKARAAASFRRKQRTKSLPNAISPPSTSICCARKRTSSVIQVVMHERDHS
jgi:hypothetical protein